jgi:RNA polymerase sigma-70 factor (ECF subfamily)
MQSNAIQDEIKWFLRLKNDDRKAFDSIYKRFIPVVYITILKLIHNQDLAEELTQQVFIRLWEKRAQLPDLLVPEAYLKTITRNLVYDHFKKVKRQQLLSIEEHQENKSFRHNELEEMLLYHDLKDQLDHLVDLLPESQRLIYKLSRIEGLKTEEIAKTLKISPRTVEHQIYRAMAKIKKSLHVYANHCIIIVLSFFNI